MSEVAVDLALARRLERAEGMAGAAYVEARRRLQPGAGSEWMEIRGAHVMFDGATSPITQTFGVGVHEPWGPSEFDAAEAFFSARNAPTSHEVCSFASPDIWSLLSGRGYSPIEASTVLVQGTQASSAVKGEAITTRLITHAESEEWTRIAAAGWRSESEDLATAMQDLGPIVTHTNGTYCFLAELRGEAIAVGVLNLHNGVALFGGACTLPAARGKGAQAALLRARLVFGMEHGADLAMVVTQPGSISQRNAERQGFRAVYTRAKWRLDQRNDRGIGR